jgi:predicted dehydrogenase
LVSPPTHRTRATELTGCRTFADIDELIAEGVDAVTFAAPTHLHHQIALACIARDVASLREIVDAARRTGVTLMVEHVGCGGSPCDHRSLERCLDTSAKSAGRCTDF